MLIAYLLLQLINLHINSRKPNLFTSAILWIIDILTILRCLRSCKVTKYICAYLARFSYGEDEKEEEWMIRIKLH